MLPENNLIENTLKKIKYRQWLFGLIKIETETEIKILKFNFNFYVFNDV
jgi:hypothetical protein